MMLFRLMRRAIGYGALGALVAFPVSYNAGKMAGSSLERVAEHTYRVEHPDTKEPYFLDFEKQTFRKVRPSLEEIFEEPFPHEPR